MDDVPLLVVTGYASFWSPESIGADLENFRRHGRLRAAPLRPGDHPLDLLSQFAASGQCAWSRPYRVLDPPNQFRDTTADEGRRLLQIVQLQVLRLVASAYPLGISMAANHPGRVDETWRRTVFAFRGLSVRWDARTEDYIVTARDHSSRTGGRNSLPTA